jgi:hypothetical protein
MRVKLTDAAIRSCEPRAAQYSVGDASCPGLCVRVTSKGVKSCAFAYRNKTIGKTEWLTWGAIPTWPWSRPVNWQTMPGRSSPLAARQWLPNSSTPRLKKI